MLVFLCALQACLECLEPLFSLADNQQQAAEAKIIPLLLDLMGPPPQHIVELEAPIKYARTFTFSPPSRMSNNGRGAVPQLYQHTVRPCNHSEVFWIMDHLQAAVDLLRMHRGIIA